MRAVHCEPEQVTVLRPGQQDSRLPYVPEDTVFVSAGERARMLSTRLREGYRRMDVSALMEMIKRPVAMDSNLQDAIFSPETLEIWIANAGPRSLACDEQYTRFDLAKLRQFFRDNVLSANQ